MVIGVNGQASVFKLMAGKPDPRKLAKEEKQRLMESPEFLSMVPSVLDLTATALTNGTESDMLHATVLMEGEGTSWRGRLWVSGGFPPPFSSKSRF